jgi:hypothetical protein
LFLLLLDGMTLVALWLLWRRSTEPDVGVKTAALLATAVWTPFFYITTLVPGTSLLAADDVPVLRVAGMSIAPNLVVAAVLFGLTVIGYGLTRETGRDA